MALEDSSAGRLVGALVSPVKTFQSIALRPTWGAALLALLLSSGVVAFVVGQHTDFRDVIVQSLKEKGRDVPEAQLEPQIQMMEKAGPAISTVSAPVFITVFLLIGALIYWTAFKLLGSDFSFKTSLAMTAHAAMPAVISALLTLPVLLSRTAPLGYADVKTGSFLRSNLAFLAPENAPAWLTALYASVDFFSLWGLVLTIIGYKAASRLSTRPVALTVILVWLLFVGVRVGLAALR
jgi:hypothetical protein